MLYIYEFFLAFLLLSGASVIGYVPAKKLFGFSDWTCRQFALYTGVGLGLISLTVFMLGAVKAFHVNYAAALCFILLIAGLWFIINSVRLSRARFQDAYDDRDKTTAFQKILIVSISLILLIILLACFAPPTAKDALVYHLAVPKFYISQGGLAYFPGNMYASFPQYTEMLFTWALLMNAPHLPALISFIFGMLTLLLIYSILREDLKVGKTSALSAVLLFITIPSAAWLCFVPYIDMAFTFYELAALAMLISYIRSLEKKHIMAMGFFVGMAAGVKYTGLGLIPLGILGILVAERFSGKDPSPKHAVINLLFFTLISSVLFIPILIKNTIFTGNPLLPFFYEIFGGKGWDIQRSVDYMELLKSFGVGHSFIDYILLPWNLLVNAEWNSQRFDGQIGPLMILVIAALFLIGKAGHKKIAAFTVFLILSFILWAGLSQQIRFLIPLMPAAIIICAFSMEHLKTGGDKKHYILTALTVATIVINAGLCVKVFARENPWAYVLGFKTEQEYLKGKIPYYDFVEYSNTSLAPKSKIFLVYMQNYGYLFDRAYYSDSVFESHTLEGILKRANSQAEVKKEFKAMGLTHVMFNAHYIFGGLSLLDERQKALFDAFLKSDCREEKGRSPYYLFSIGKGTGK